METNYHKPFTFEFDTDADGTPILWRILDAFDALMCVCYKEDAAKEIIERLNESF